MVNNNPDMVDPDKISLTNKNDLPTKKSVLALYHFFRNLDRTSSKFFVAEKVAQGGGEKSTCLRRIRQSWLGSQGGCGDHHH